MDLLGILLKQLRLKSEYVSDRGDIKKWIVIDDAQNCDKELIELLLNNKELKEAFFLPVKSALIFNQHLFTIYLEQKNFLNESFTSYRNKIGLTDDGKFFAQRNEIVLSWPFKDCILEGGQTKEEKARNEIFFNEVVGRDEISQLLEPKVLTNGKRFSSKGKHELEGFSRNEKGQITDNIILKGNNLLGLYSLQREFAGRVKLIYIDPPYNTDNDSFKYNDRFSHSSWLTFMKNRLEVAKSLLREDGAIFIQIDDREMAYLKVLCDEIFGRENFKESISVKNGSESGVNAINVMRGEQLFKVKEHLLYYAADSSLHRFNPTYVKAAGGYNTGYRYEVRKAGSKYEITDLYKKILQKHFNQDSLRGLSREQKHIFAAIFEETCLQNNENVYALKMDIQKSGATFKKFALENKAKKIVEEFRTSDGRTNLVYRGGMLTPLAPRIVRENNQLFYGTLISDFWPDIGATPSGEGNVELKSGKKPEKLLQRIIELGSISGDIVLDFHLGTGTTCAVAHRIGRQYLGIEQLDYEENDAVNRLNFLLKETPISDNRKAGRLNSDFVYIELKQSNLQFISTIGKAKSSNEINKIWQAIKNKSFVKYNVDIINHEKNFSEFSQLKLAEQKEILFELLDKNQLYVNLSSLNDLDFNCTDAEKKITKDFYQEII